MEQLGGSMLDTETHGCPNCGSVYRQEGGLARITLTQVVGETFGQPSATQAKLSLFARQLKLF